MIAAKQITHLVRHTATPCAAVKHIEVSVLRLSADTLSLDYRLDADLAGLRLPPRAEPRRTHELWRHTCLEAFLRQPDAPGYCELNFAPSTEWAAYRFTGYREGMAPLPDVWAPQTTVRIAENGLELHAIIPVGDITELRGAARLRLAIAAVIEEANGRISYWALSHPPGKPDFHHQDGFVLEV